jgi:phosphoserine/homoserine phosphotransferase
MGDVRATHARPEREEREALIVACLDLEGVLTPEIWIALSEATGIRELSRTTRDEPDYDVLMRYRLDLLARHGLGIEAIDAVIKTIDPLPGAIEMLAWLRARLPVVILSDTFYGFARPLMAKLGHPTLFCHDLEVDAKGAVVGYRLRMRDQKRAAIQAFRGLGFRTLAAGDSYNDATMLSAADAGILFRAPDNVKAALPALPTAESYDDLRRLFTELAGKIDPSAAASLALVSG